MGITWADVKKKICSANPPSVKPLTNAELQVLLINLPSLRKSRDESTIDKVVAVFDKKKELEGQDFQEFQEDDFSVFVDEGPTMQAEIKHAFRCTQRFIRTLVLQRPKFGAAGKGSKGRAKEIVWADVKKKICSVKPASVESLTNAELQVLLRNVPKLQNSRDETTIGKVVAVFERKREITGKDFQEFQEYGFSIFVDEDPALQEEIKHACKCARKYIVKL